MDTLKKAWVTPKAFVEEFTPNEYISTCWTVACAVGEGDYGGYGAQDNWKQWNHQEPWGNNHDNHTGSCSQAINNQFVVDGEKVSFYAENNDQQGSLNGGYCSYIDIDGSGTISKDDIIFWYTLSGNKDRRWNHYGTVELADKSHPNRS